jgi:uncharacterized protein
MFDRPTYQVIKSNLGRQKVTLLLGARRVGKTALLRRLQAELGPACLSLNGEDADVQQLLEQRTVANYRRLLQDCLVLIIDEAQFVPDMGRKAKLMIDELKPLHIILTGSSMLELEQMSEPLVGRTITLLLYPLSQMELKATESLLETRQRLEDRLIYGSYPEVVLAPTIAERQQYLHELIHTWLIKDMLAMEDIRNPQKIRDLLRLLAWQVGSEVSNQELGRQLGMSKNTVERYLDMLSKVFVIYQRQGFSRNLRKEVVKSSKWYFTDNGVRNALISQFMPLAARQDAGQLWENYLMIERTKHHAYTGKMVNAYFWRTYDQQEIDLVEESDGKLMAFEMKMNDGPVKPPVAFSVAYPEAGYTLIHGDNYLDWIGG